MGIVRLVVLCTCLFGVCVAQKEIFIPGLNAREKEHVENESSAKTWGRILAKEALTDIYAQKHNLPQYEQYKRDREERINGCIRDAVARERVGPRVKSLSKEELREYYAKIVKGEGGPYSLMRHSFGGSGKEYFPAFSEALLGRIRTVLFDTWVKREKEAISNADIEKVKKDHKYRDIVDGCNGHGTHMYGPGESAFNNAMLLRAKKRVEGMSAQQRKDLFERRKADYDEPQDTHEQLVDMAKNELEGELLKELAQSYIIKSDSPYVLEAIEEIRAWKIGPLSV